MGQGACPWRDLPPELGSWRTVQSRFRRWRLSGVGANLFKAPSAEPDFEQVFFDATSQKGALRLPLSAVSVAV